MKKLLFLLLTYLLSGTTYAQYGSNLGFRLSLQGLTSLKYQEYAKEESSGNESNISAIKAGGSQLEMAGVMNEYELIFTYRSIKPQGLEYLSKRNEIELLFAYHWAKFPWIAPTVGYFQYSQSGDTTAADASAAFVDKNTALTFGLDTNSVVYTYGTKHSALIQARFNYLTTFEKSRNFGTESQAGVGYVYQEGKAQAGLVFGYIKQFYLAEKKEEDLETYLRVRTEYEGMFIGLQLQYK